MLKNTMDSYGSITKFLHWAIFFLVAALVIIGYTADMFPKAYQGPLINVHKLIGLLVFILVLVRMLWTLNNIKPILPDHMRAWERAVERFVRLFLYLSLFLMPFSGWVMATASGRPPHLFGMAFPLPGILVDKTVANNAWLIHATTAWVLITLVSIHVLAALKHNFINKDHVLKRMMPR